MHKSSERSDNGCVWNEDAPTVVSCAFFRLYNVLEDTLTEHTPDYYSTVQLAVTYDKKADCPLFKKFLKESMGGDMDQVALIQEMLGYFLIPVNSAQKCFVIVGVASAGKSVLLRVLNDVLLGKQNVSNVSWQALNERFKTAELFGKLAIGSAPALKRTEKTAHPARLPLKRRAWQA